MQTTRMESSQPARQSHRGGASAPYRLRRQGVLAAALGAALLLAVPASSLGADEDKPLELKAKFPVGQRCLQRMSLLQDQKIFMPGTAEPMNQKVTQIQDMAVTVVKERPGNGRELELEFVALKIEMRMGDQVMLKFDSQADPKDDAGNPIAVMMRKLVGAKVRILTDAAGKIEKIEGAKELKEKLAADGPPQLQMMTEGMLSEDAIRQMGVIPMFLPEKPVKTGDRWPYQAEFNLGPMGTLQVVMNWTARGWDSHDQKKCIRLTNTGTISSKAGSSTNAAMSLTVTSGDSTGQCWFDPELGMVVDSVADQKLSLKVAAMGQNLNMVMQQAVTNRVVEVTQAPK